MKPVHAAASVAAALALTAAAAALPATAGADPAPPGATDQATLYINTDDDILSAPADDPRDTTTLVGGNDLPDNYSNGFVAVDENTVYYTDWGSSAYETPRTGGPSKEIDPTLTDASGIAVHDGTVYVMTLGGTLHVYPSGKTDDAYTVDLGLDTLPGASGIAVHDGTMYIAAHYTDAVATAEMTDIDDGDDTATSTPLVSGLGLPIGVTVDGNTLYVSLNNSVAAVNLSEPNPTAEEVAAGFVSLGGLAVVGDTLYVTDYGKNTVDAVDLTEQRHAGATPVITDLVHPHGIAAWTPPEPPAPEPDCTGPLQSLGTLAPLDSLDSLGAVCRALDD